MAGVRWHYNFALWEELIGMRLSRADRLSLFAHYLPFEKGHGLEAASRYYFRTAPEQLHVDQVLGLLAVSRGPLRFSPHNKPEQYRREVERLRRKYPTA